MMYTESQIQEIVAEKIALFKEAEGKKKLPEYTEVYVDSVDYFKRLSVHTTRGKFPSDIFKKRAPNQTDEEYDYMKSIYKTHTFPIWTRFTSTINRIWNDANWHIAWKEFNGHESPQSYIEKEYPLYGSLESYYKTIITPTKEKDPNGVICHKPYSLPVLEKDGSFVIDQTQFINPVAVYYQCSQVVGYKDSEYALIELTEKSNVEYGGRTVKEGKVFEFYDKDAIWKIIQVGKKIEYKFELIPYYIHNLGYLPVSKLKGKPEQKENEVLYQSHFMAALEPMDCILYEETILDACKIKQAFPHKWEYADECNYQNEWGTCVNGRIQTEDGPDDCPACKGTGRRNSMGVMGTYQVKMPNMSDDTGARINIPPFGWGAPDPAIMEFMRKEIIMRKEEALSLLNLYNSNSEVKGSDTALGKMIDREETLMFIKSISDQVFDLFEFSHKCILQMRYGLDVDLPQISPPKTFAIRNEVDLTEEIARAIEIGLPDVAIRSLLLEYLNTRFNTQDHTKNIVDLVFKVDRLATSRAVDIQSMKLSGTVASWEVILHTSIYTFIGEELINNPEFFDLDFNEQQRLLIDRAKNVDSQIKASQPKVRSVDDILANAG